MFVRHCREERPHKTHIYQHQWRQTKRSRRESWIDKVWTVIYRCQGTR